MTAAAPPRWLSVIPDAIPRELTALRAWYPALIRPKAGNVGRWDKLPAEPDTAEPARWSDPATRRTFSDAYMAYQRDPRFGGIGVMMDAEAGLIGIDLDDSLTEDGTVTPWGQAIVDTFPNAYWEKSISGTGLRGFCRGTLPVGGCRSKIEGCSVELYADVRFLVVTGQAIAYVDELPQLQASVDALHARLTAGRVRATGTAIGSGLTGRMSTVPPEGLAILEAAMGDRRGARILDIWSREDLHVAGASEDDWALATELIYQALRAGQLDQDSRRRLVEQTMRGGCYRAKWDERRGQTTWLAQDVANADATVLKRLGDRPIVQLRRSEILADELADERPPADETPEQIIARLERALAQSDRELGHARAVVAQQMTIIRAERDEKQQLAEQITGWKVVLSNPKLKPADRIAALPAIEHVLSARAMGQAEIHIRYPGLVNGWGLPESTLQKSMDVLTEPDGAPLAKRSEPGPAITVETRRGPRTVTPPMVLLRATVDGDLYAALGAYDPQLPQRGGHREPPPPCPDDPAASAYVERTVVQCGDCRRPLGAARERWFTRRQNEGLTDGLPDTVVVVTLGRQNDALTDGHTPAVGGRLSSLHNDGLTGHDGEEQARRAATVLPIPIRPPRRERYEQPSWLDQWPDPPDVAPMLRAYDDVPIAGGES